MRIEGVIRPTGDGAGFNRDRWCQLVGQRPEFRRYPSRRFRNPFTGRTVTVQPPGDGAEVVMGDCMVGSVYWSMSDEPLVNVSVEQSAIHLVVEWAAVLGGEFHVEPRGIKSDA